jgi:hypothetical protein
MRYLIPWQFVRVAGSSMTPNLLPDDIVIARHTSTITIGAVVLARFHRRPDLLVIKRVSAPAPRGWLVASDNFAGVDSSSYGPADVLAVATWFIPGKSRHQPLGRPLNRLLSRLPRRIAAVTSVR